MFKSSIGAAAQAARSIVQARNSSTKVRFSVIMRLLKQCATMAVSWRYVTIDARTCIISVSRGAGVGNTLYYQVKYLVAIYCTHALVNILVVTLMNTLKRMLYSFIYSLLTLLSHIYLFTYN
jgi:hypothetical protein